jgi:hypothetical protein
MQSMYSVTPTFISTLPTERLHNITSVSSFLCFILFCALISRNRANQAKKCHLGPNSASIFDELFLQGLPVLGLEMWISKSNAARNNFEIVRHDSPVYAEH